MDCERTFLTNERRKLSPTYAVAELVWYLSRENNIAMIKHYAPQYDSFAEPDDTAFGAYGYRIANNYVQMHGFAKDLLWLAVEHLKTKENSRQAIVAMWRPSDLGEATWGLKRDLPCNISWQFLRRDGKLHMICNMRSNDVWLGMPYDVFVNTCILRMLADELNLECGTYTHNVGSLHLYDKNEVAAREAEDASPLRDMAHRWTEKSPLWYEKRIVKAEVRARQKVALDTDFIIAGAEDNSLASDVTWLLAHANGFVKQDDAVWRLRSPLLRKGLELCSSSKAPTS